MTDISKSTSDNFFTRATLMADGDKLIFDPGHHDYFTMAGNPFGWTAGEHYTFVGQKK